MKIKIYCVFLFFLVSCNKGSQDDLLVKNVLNTILSDTILLKHNKEENIHVFFERYNNKYSRIRFSLHNLKPQKKEEYIDVSFDGNSCYSYKKYPEVFFTLHLRRFDFFIEEIEGQDFYLNKMEPYFVQSKDTIYINDETDF